MNHPVFKKFSMQGSKIIFHPIFRISKIGNPLHFLGITLQFPCNALASHL